MTREVSVFEPVGRGRSDGAGDLVRLAARAFERDRYLAALLAPRAVRDDLIALAALAGELARIPGYVSEPMIGEIRLQWWRDVVDALVLDGENAASHPVADALGVAMRRHRLPAASLHGLIDAQSARLTDQPFADVAQLEANIDLWDGTMFRLAWQILCGPDHGDAAPPLLRPAAQAYGFARLLIEAPAELAQGRMLLPAGLMAEHGLSLPIFAGEESRSGWLGLIGALQERTDESITRIAADYRIAPRHVRLAALPVALVRPYLRLCQSTDLAALQATDIAPLTRVWRLWVAHRTGRL